MKSFGELRENLDKNKMKKMGINNPLAGFPYNEKTMTQSQIDKREKIVMDLKKNMSDFKKRYGKDAKDVMYATATKMALADETMSPFTPPTTKFGLGLPPTSKMKKQMDFILKRDKSFQNRMNKLVTGRETDKDGRITLYFKSARSRQKFRRHAQLWYV